MQIMKNCVDLFKKYVCFVITCILTNTEWNSSIVLASLLSIYMRSHILLVVVKKYIYIYIYFI